MAAILLLLAAVAALAFLLAWRRPDAFRVERSIHVDAPPGRIGPLIGDLPRLMSAPIRCENTIAFVLVLAPGVQGTGVTWSMAGRSPAVAKLVAKLMGLLFDTGRMVGRDLERGLAALKEQAETPIPAKAA